MDELDCRTLFHDYYEYELGLTIPDYDWQSARTEEDAKRIADEVGFVLVHPKTLREHDLILLRLTGLDLLHFAVYLADGRILHHVEHKLSARVQYGSRYRQGTRAIYRHRSLVRDTDAVHD
jgi:cell wall-associated NlpC family hydrolase